jgi:hypothetical protein
MKELLVVFISSITSIIFVELCLNNFKKVINRNRHFEK